MKRIFFTLIGILYANMTFSQSKNNEPVNKTEIVADKPAEHFIKEIRDIVKQNHIGAINPDVLVEQSVNKDADLEAASKWVLGF